MIDFDQGDSGGPLIATATRHSNSTQKRFIFKQTNYILAFYRQVFLGRHRELWCWLRWTRISRCEIFLLNVQFLIFLHPGAYTRASCFLSWLGEQFGFVLTKNKHCHCDGSKPPRSSGWRQSRAWAESPAGAQLVRPPGGGNKTTGGSDF